MRSGRAFVIMPFGVKKATDGTEINFDDVYRDLLAPAIEKAGLEPHRADADRRGGSIHADMFQELLLSEFVVADLTLDNPNVWYEVGVRHALRAAGSVLVYALRERLPFDIAGQRMLRYTLKSGALDPTCLDAERAALTQAVEATLEAWRGRATSPVYQQLPNLREPDWKTLKVGDVNEYWDELATWERRIDVARRNQRPGDILVLADETPNRLLRFEALCTAGRALKDLHRPQFALEVLRQALEIEPDDVPAQQLVAIVLGRIGRHAEARALLEGLATRVKDGETLGLLARTYKDEWTRVWNAHPGRRTDPIAAARDTAPALAAGAKAYADAFRSAPSDSYPGINALTLGRLYEHVTGRKSELPLDAIAGGVRWAVAAALEKRRDYWALATQAELALVEGRADDASEAYEEAAALAVLERDRFALDSSSRQLGFLAELGFRSAIAATGSAILDRAESQLDLPVGTVASENSKPRSVIVFSGHMIDDPGKRGPGRPKPARFPADKVAAAGERLRRELDGLGVEAGDLALCGGASGGDLLFAESCLERGIRVELRLARIEREFLAESVTFADPDRRWEQAFFRVKGDPRTTVLVMPDELGPTPDGVSVHDRCNRWILNTALAHGPERVSFLALWNGEPGDGPGGTQHMVELVRRLTGRQPVIVDPGTL